MITYADTGSIMITPWQRSLAGILTASAVGCTGSGREGAVALDLSIDPSTCRWSVRCEDEVVSGQAASAEAARPTAEDVTALMVRIRVAERRVDDIEREALALQRELDEALAARGAAPPPSPKPEADRETVREASPGPKGPTTPLWPEDRLRALGSRIHRVRFVNGWSWRALATAAAREGGPDVDQTTDRKSVV